VTADIDIYRTANIMLRQHGSEASIHAAMRADELLDQGDLDGQRVWLRVIKAIAKLMVTERGDAPLH